MKGVWPKANGKVSTSEESTDRIGNDKVTTLDRAILMRSIGASRKDIVPEFGKESNDLGV